jgi:hypothetical protein
MSFTRKLLRFEKAVREHEWKGSQPPEDWSIIDKNYEDAKKAVLRSFGLEVAKYRDKKERETK